MTQVGERFGDWEVIGEPQRGKANANRTVRCRCGCGEERDVPICRLKQGGSRGCGPGCLLRGRVQPGQRYGSWTVLELRLAITQHGDPRSRAPSGLRRRALVRCDCGREADVVPAQLTHGRSTRCQSCAVRARAVSRTKHGGSGSRSYGSWSAMNRRCHGTGDPAWKHYGGRGITVCERWRSESYGGQPGGFERFLSDMGERPEGTSIDRIDSDGDYEPSNCRWATAREQRANRRR